MTSWFAKFRISAALDGGKALTPSLRQRITTSDGLRTFEENTIALDRGLKDAPPAPKLPHSLHSSIMRAVREGSRSTAPKRRPALLRWLPAPALAALVLVGGWCLLHRPALPLGTTPTGGAQSLAVLTATLDMGDQMAHTMPSEIVAPMSDELERLGRDLDNAAQFVLASIP